VQRLRSFKIREFLPRRDTDHPSGAERACSNVGCKRPQDLRRLLSGLHDVVTASRAILANQTRRIIGGDDH
jgi:hypothetical protein